MSRLVLYQCTQSAVMASTSLRPVSGPRRNGESLPTRTVSVPSIVPATEWPHGRSSVWSGSCWTSETLSPQTGQVGEVFTVSPSPSSALRSCFCLRSTLLQSIVPISLWRGWGVQGLERTPVLLPVTPKLGATASGLQTAPTAQGLPPVAVLHGRATRAGRRPLAVPGGVLLPTSVRGMPTPLV
jgi:hypothetical protein